MDISLSENLLTGFIHHQVFNLDLSKSLKISPGFLSHAKYYMYNKHAERNSLCNLL